MSLYAVDDGDLIHAAEAEPGKMYSCLDCYGPVKVRCGRMRFSHFYHLKTTPSCRLYSKSENHLLAQLELQRLFPKGALELEKPFPSIQRIADVCWEKEKIVFEIQCSLLSECDAMTRMRDYASVGYRVIWLLDDKKYNRRFCKPGERLLRQEGAYFLQVTPFEVYDQWESFLQEQRIRKSRPIPIDLRRTPYQFRFTKQRKKSLYRRILEWIKVKCGMKKKGKNQP